MSTINGPQSIRVACIGGGPAGLTAAYLLSKKNIDVTVFEMDENYLGGISKTVEYKGYRFDIGGHRFFSKSQDVENFWTEILGPEMLERPRSSKIFYNNKFFSYPLKALEALLKLGPIEAIICFLSYLKSKLFPIKNPTNFQDWVTNQFGARLFSIFFKTYTEKVWGMSCKDISADWAAQRIKGLSLGTAIWYALFPQKEKKNSEVIKTLINSFRYPKFGPGQMWEETGKKIQQNNGKIFKGVKVTNIHQQDNNKWKLQLENKNPSIESIGEEKLVFDHIISSAPLKEFIAAINIAPPQIVQAAENLKYRDFLTIALIVDETNIFSENWIYIHDPSVKVGRIQNFKSWSPYLIPNKETNCYGLEYFCFKGDGLWNSKDHDLIELAKKEIIQLGLAKKEEIKEGIVIRQEKAYPVYDDYYKDNVEKIKTFINTNCKGIHLSGRNGMHKYNNQDHAMMTSMLTVKNILSGQNIYDVWNVNQDAEYHETSKPEHERGNNTFERLVPKQTSK